MATRKVQIKWSLADVLRDKKISVDQFIEGVQKIDPSYKRNTLERLIRCDMRRVNIELLGVVVSLLDCEIEDILYHGKKKPSDTFYKGDMFSLVSRKTAESYFPVEITEEETEAFDFLRHQKVGSAKEHVGRSVAVDDVITLLETKKTERSTYIANFFKVLKNEYLPVREDKASNRFMCFLRNSTADEGYVSLVLMSNKAVTLLCKHSFTTLDILKNFTTFRNKVPVVTPWFEIDALKSVYGFSDYNNGDFNRQVLNKSTADIKKRMGIDVKLELHKVARDITHVRFLVA